MKTFPAIRIEGGLLGPDTLDQLLAAELPGQRPADFGLDGRRNLTDEIAAAFADARAQWQVFRHRLERLPDSDPATSLTRDAWVVPFLGLLGYDLGRNQRAYEVDGLTFAISHCAGEDEQAPPVHIVGARQELGRLPRSGRPRLAPHSLVQEFLNRTERLWGLVTNGLTLRLLRNSTSIRRQAYVEFDLRAMLEEQRFEDFAALYRLLHRTRLPRTAADAHECLLERYYQHALEQGGRVRDRLRDGVEEAIKRLANGFLAHPANAELRASVASGARRAAGDGDANALAPEDLYRQLLRLVYRFLFLLVSEERGLISPSPLYREQYSVARLRRRVEDRRAYDDHDDLWHSLRVLWRVLADERFAAMLEAAPLNGELFAPLVLDGFTISNRDLLEAFGHLAFYHENGALRRVNYAALDVEELGSVYESLLDYHPVIEASGEGRGASSEGRAAGGEGRAAGGVRFDLAPGSERKSTGSYYTPPELVAELIRSALEPVVGERLIEAKRMANSEWPVVPQTIQERFTHDVFPRLSRPGGLAKSGGGGEASISPDPNVPASGALRDDKPAPQSGNLSSGEYRRGLGTALHGGVHSLSSPGQRQPDGTGNTPPAQHRSEPVPSAESAGAAGAAPHPGQAAQPPRTQPPTEKELALAWQSAPFAIRHSLFAEHALLSIRVLDPACGSGHFLLAAARRLGKELARVRTGEEEPAPERVREAIRDVVAHCLYGVDKNPLAVELCRVALWLEAHCEGKPLTFLDHRIRCGDSLVGVFDLEALHAGIPDEAFTPREGDDRAAARSLKQRNKQERSGQMTLHFDAPVSLADLRRRALDLAAIPDDTPAHVRRKAELFSAIRRSPLAMRQLLACDLWTASFFQPLQKGGTAITTDAVRQALAGQPVHGQVAGLAQAIAAHQHFFHWPLEFPEVFAANRAGEDPLAARHSPLAGFDVVLGNPPWERIKLQEEEFFASRDRQIADAPNAAARKRLISELPRANPALWTDYRDALRSAKADSLFMRTGGRFPLTGRGDINTYAVFAELFRCLLRPGGRAGLIVPTGIATDNTTKDFFADLVSRGALASLYDFENRQKLFPAVHSRMKFCLLTLRGQARDEQRDASGESDHPLAARHSPRAAGSSSPAEFAFFCQQATDLNDPERRFTLTPADFALLNPNTRTAPIFRSRRDAELTKHIYRRVPVLINERMASSEQRAASGERASSEQRAASGESEPPLAARHSPLASPIATRHSPIAESNPWGVEFLAMFHMANDSGLFRTREQLEAEGWRLEGAVFERGGGRYLPLYEAKLIHQFDHRWATYDGRETRDVTDAERADPDFPALPRYWVREAEVEARLRAKSWDRGWLLGWRRIAPSTNERTVIAAVIPRCGAGDNVFLFLSKQTDTFLLPPIFSSYAFDFTARQKLGGTNMNFFIFEQLPVLPPSVFAQPCPWAQASGEEASREQRAASGEEASGEQRATSGASDELLAAPRSPPHSPLAIRHSPPHSPLAIRRSPSPSPTGFAPASWSSRTPRGTSSPLPATWATTARRSATTPSGASSCAASWTPRSSSSTWAHQRNGSARRRRNSRRSFPRRARTWPTSWTSSPSSAARTRSATEPIAPGRPFWRNMTDF
jgi:hypothetical protein